MPTMQLAFLSTPDTLMIMAVCLVVFGPKKLPEIARTVGKFVREFRNASDEIVRDITRPQPEPVRPVRNTTTTSTEVTAEVVPLTVGHETTHASADASPAAKADDIQAHSAG